jgi:TonB family protein
VSDVTTPPMPFAAILESQPPWWRLGGGGALVVLAYLGMLFAALSLGAHSSSPLVAAAPKQLVVTLLDRPPVETQAELKPTAAGIAKSSVSSPPRARESLRRAPAQAPSPAIQAKSARVEPIVPLASAAVPVPAVVRAPPRAAGAVTSAGGSLSATSQGSGGPAGTASGARSGAEVTVLPFTDGMTRPKLLDMVAPQYTREARDANVKGLFLAKCVITTSGALQKCRVVKGLPMMDQAVLSALARWRYSPVIYQGKPVAVDYVIQVRLAGPE